MYRGKKSKGLVRKWMENGHKVTDQFFISFYRTGIQYLREMTYKSVWGNLSVSCSKPVILKISSLKDRCRQWLRIVPGTWQYFWQKDSQDAYFWYWKRRQKTVQVHDSSQPASSHQAPHQAWSWPPHMGWRPSLALTHPCPQGGARCPGLWLSLLPGWGQRDGLWLARPWPEKYKTEQATKYQSPETVTLFLHN